MTPAEQEMMIRRDSLPLSAMTEFLSLGKPDRLTIGAFASSAPVRVFTPAVDSVFPSLTPLGKSFLAMRTRISEASLDIPRRTCAAVVWGNAKSVVLTDSCLLIALNHFLGADYAGYSGWPLYIREAKTPSQVSYSVCEAEVATAYPYDGGAEPTVLSRLAYEGALVCAKMALVPDASLHEALGYDRRQLHWLDDNARELWKSLAAQNLLYSTSETAAERLTAPAPATSMLSPDCPGRAGRYFGYLIARHCMRQKGLSLPELLSPGFYDDPSLLINSRFTP